MPVNGIGESTSETVRLLALNEGGKKYTNRVGEHGAHTNNNSDFKKKIL